jgi:hypothetical protein
MPAHQTGVSIKIPMPADAFKQWVPAAAAISVNILFQRILVSLFVVAPGYWGMFLGQ